MYKLVHMFEDNTNIITSLSYKIIPKYSTQVSTY